MVTIAPSMEAFARECLRLAPGSQNGGMAPGDPNQGGYHNSRDKLLSLGRSGDYSLKHPWDKRGNGSRARAFDWTFPDAQAGNYGTIRRYMTRIREAYDRQDDRLAGWREALGQQDADGDPEGIDFVERRLRTPDMSHMWHIHFSIMAEFVDAEWPYNNMLSILRGDAPRGADVALDPDEKRLVDNADKYLWKLHTLEAEVPIGGGTLHSELVPALVKLFDDVEEIRETVTTLQSAPGGITQDMLDLAVRRALRAIPEA